MTTDGLYEFEAWLRDELRDAGCEIRMLSPEGMAKVTVRRMREQGWRVVIRACDDLAPNLGGLLDHPHRCVLSDGHGGWHEDDAVPPMKWSLNHDSLTRPIKETQ